MISLRLQGLIASLILAFSCLAVLAEELLGRVVGVTDGDTITVLVDLREQHKIRLAGIDAPEKRQPYGQRSKELLSDLAFNHMVRVEWSKRDRYGRLVGKVLVNNTDVNLEMVELGLAWHYKHYESEQSAADRRAYALAQDRARSARLGLWREKDPVAPWDYRRGAR